MKYDTLYAKDENNSVRVWWMETNPENLAQYRSVSGVKGSDNLIYSGWKTAKAKNTGKINATTPEEQAVSEIQSSYKNRMSRKYYLDEADIDGGVKFEQPMLAGKYDPAKIDFKESIYSQPKLDGARNITTKDGMFSRNGKPITGAPHIFEALQEFFKEYPDAILDGELYNHDLKHDFNQIISIVRKKEPNQEELELSKQHIQYHVYDTIREGNFHSRTNWLQFSTDIRHIDCIKLVTTTLCTSHEDIDSLYGEYLADGYEGQMIRLNREYEPKRSKFLLKRKEFKDEEFGIVRIETGVGSWQGYAKRIICKLEDGREFGSGLKGTQEFAKELLDNADFWIGKQCTVRFQDYTPDGIPRFGVAYTFHPEERM